MSTGNTPEKSSLPLVGKEGEDISPAPLEIKVAELKMEIRQTKFLSVLFIVLLLDFLLFQNIDNWAGGLVIGIMQLLLLLFIGRIWEVPIVDEIIEGILSAISSNSGDKPNSK